MRSGDRSVTASKYTYRVFRGVAGPLLRVLYRVRVDGVERVPAHGPVILASNHVSFCDSIFLPLVLKRRVTFVAKAEYFEQRRSAWFFRMLGQIPVVRGDGPAAQRALEAAAGVLAAGGVFGIYPEGTRSPDGRLYKGHTGVARLALERGAPVVAVAMLGTREAQPIGRVVPTLFARITVRFGEPLSFDGGRDRAQDPATLRAVTDEVMAAIGALSGQERAATYAPKKGTDAELVDEG